MIPAAGRRLPALHRRVATCAPLIDGGQLPGRCATLVSVFGNAFRHRILVNTVLLSAHAWRHLPHRASDWRLISLSRCWALADCNRCGFLRRVPFRLAPSLFYIKCSDRFITATIWCGVGLSIFAIGGWSESFGLAVSILTWALLWIIYLSVVNVGQTFYGFGWETMLAETGFLAIFLGSSDTRPPLIVMWLIVWVLFRTMFGAGMIKVRADPCWRDLTCLFYHYETQPLPNPLSWYLHHAPRWFHKAGVLFNHFTELIVPWFYFAPAPLCYWAGGLTILFQITLILSGNLSWLNYITIVLCIPCFDDRFFARFLHIPHSTPAEMSFPHAIAVGALTAIVLALSWRPARNLFSRRQLMNASFEPLHLVNTYGAFGAVTRERLEVIIKGSDAKFLDASIEWREYEFKGKPGDVNRRPCIVSPYHWRLDWQMWFSRHVAARLSSVDPYSYATTS